MGGNGTFARAGCDPTHLNQYHFPLLKLMSRSLLAVGR
ncbi:hypothetical protein HYPP_03578 [Hyphomicrobium sp. ghe19]|nr:hypothetical protein HYPP_03578 [Hyphomicrobium sp. ghe19]